MLITIDTKIKNKEVLKKELIIAIKTMGYTAIAEEIKNNRHPLTNAITAINMYFKDLASNRYDIENNIVYAQSDETLKDLELKKEYMINLCKYCFRDNNPKQLKYLKLKIDYANSMFNYGKKMQLFNSYIYSDKCIVADINQCEFELDELLKIKTQCENELDKFLLNELN